MKKLNQFYNKIYNKQIDGTGLAIFRICYSTILLCEILQMFYFRHLIFDEIPYLNLPEISSAIPIIIWAISVAFVLFGLFTKTATIINYLMSLILIGTINTFEYHVFYAYMGINFLLMFMPINQCLSLDRKILEKKTGVNQSYSVSQIYYLLPLYLGVALVYFDSVFFKLSSSMWLSGLGSWLPSSLPMCVHVNNSIFLNNEVLVKIVGLGTILFETIFIFLFFRKKFRIPLFIIGMILHLGILLEFPIPWFALTVCCIYILIIPVHFWKILFRSRNNLNYNESLENNVTLPKDVKYKFIKYFVLIISVLQFGLLYNTWLIGDFKKAINLNEGIDRAISRITTGYEGATRILFGITNHPVFSNEIHFDNYNHIVAVVYTDGTKQTWLPIIDKNGMADYYIYGCNWVNYTFRVNSLNVNTKKLGLGIRDYSAFWAHKHNINLDNAKFLIKVKKIDTPKGWEKDFLNKQIAKPWIDGGYVEWKNKEFINNIKDIEKI